jgi:succinyl-CoA synthetase beta subunit
VPAGRVAKTVSEVNAAIEEIGLPVVIKAQVLVGAEEKWGG